MSKMINVATIAKTPSLKTEITKVKTNYQSRKRIFAIIQVPPSEANARYLEATVSPRETYFFRCNKTDKSGVTKQFKTDFFIRKTILTFNPFLAYSFF